MKKILLLAAFVAGGFGMQAQGIDLGLKAGANFASINGADNADNITSWHAGAALELNFVPVFSLQVEGLYSSQGAEVDGEDFKLDYMSVPVMAKYYILPDRLSLMAGPQFSFLVNDDNPWESAGDAYENESVDIAAAGGVELKIIKGLFAQARYTIGFNDVNNSFEGKNAVFQLSLGYYFL
jgi:hypothetical protein